MMQNSICAPSQEIVIAFPDFIFYNEILFLYSQRVGLPKIFGEFF